MPTISISYQDLNSLLPDRITRKDILHELSAFGVDIERISGDELVLEVLPNRPDLYSVEGIARALECKLTAKPREYMVRRSKVKVKVDPLITKIRPYICAALVKHVKLNAQAILSLMQLQEKLHGTLGRDRRKLAIGVHDYSKIKPNFTYKAVTPTSIRFAPLGTNEEMHLDEILRKHEKGIAYGHLLKGFNLYPILLDTHQQVLSFPPIINSKLTTVTQSTENVFIDVTGWDFNLVSFALNLVSTAFVERGGMVYLVEVDGSWMPRLEWSKLELDHGGVNRTLGTRLSPKKIITSLRRMGYRADKKEVMVPPWRNDVFSERDLIEDVAIGYGYKKLSGTLPRALTFGEEREIEVRSERLRMLLVGLGFNEVVTLSLSNPKEQFTQMGMKKKKAAMILNPLTKEHSITRVSLLPSLLRILSANKHREMPQRVFELGDVVIDYRNKRKLGALIEGDKANFSETKSIVESLLTNLGIEYELKEKLHSSFIEGRCASVFLGGKELGYFGELHPEVITSFELAHPVTGFELDVELL